MKSLSSSTLSIQHIKSLNNKTKKSEVKPNIQNQQNYQDNTNGYMPNQPRIVTMSSASSSLPMVQCSSSSKNGGVEVKQYSKENSRGLSLAKSNKKNSESLNQIDLNSNSSTLLKTSTRSKSITMNNSPNTKIINNITFKAMNMLIYDKIIALLNDLINDKPNGIPLIKSYESNSSTLTFNIFIEPIIHYKSWRLTYQVQYYATLQKNWDMLILALVYLQDHYVYLRFISENDIFKVYGSGNNDLKISLECIFKSIQSTNHEPTLDQFTIAYTNNGNKYTMIDSPIKLLAETLLHMDNVDKCNDQAISKMNKEQIEYGESIIRDIQRNIREAKDFQMKIYTFWDKEHAFCESFINQIQLIQNNVPWSYIIKQIQGGVRVIYQAPTFLVKLSDIFSHPAIFKLTFTKQTFHSLIISLLKLLYDLFSNTYYSGNLTLDDIKYYNTQELSIMDSYIQWLYDNIQIEQDMAKLSLDIMAKKVKISMLFRLIDDAIKVLLHAQCKINTKQSDTLSPMMMKGIKESNDKINKKEDISMTNADITSSIINEEKNEAYELYPLTLSSIMWYKTGSWNVLEDLLYYEKISRIIGLEENLDVYKKYDLKAIKDKEEWRLNTLLTSANNLDHNYLKNPFSNKSISIKGTFFNIGIDHFKKFHEEKLINNKQLFDNFIYFDPFSKQMTILLLHIDIDSWFKAKFSSQGASTRPSLHYPITPDLIITLIVYCAQLLNIWYNDLNSSMIKLKDHPYILTNNIPQDHVYNNVMPNQTNINNNMDHQHSLLENEIDYLVTKVIELITIYDNNTIKSSGMNSCTFDYQKFNDYILNKSNASIKYPEGYDNIGGFDGNGLDIYYTHEQKSIIKSKYHPNHHLSNLSQSNHPHQAKNLKNNNKSLNDKNESDNLIDDIIIAYFKDIFNNDMLISLKTFFYIGKKYVKCDEKTEFPHYYLNYFCKKFKLNNINNLIRYYIFDEVQDYKETLVHFIKNDASNNKPIDMDMPISNEHVKSRNLEKSISPSIDETCKNNGNIMKKNEVKISSSAKRSISTDKSKIKLESSIKSSNETKTLKERYSTANSINNSSSNKSNQVKVNNAKLSKGFNTTANLEPKQTLISNQHETNSEVYTTTTITQSKEDILKKIENNLNRNQVLLEDIYKNQTRYSSSSASLHGSSSSYAYAISSHSGHNSPKKIENQLYIDDSHSRKEFIDSSNMIISSAMQIKQEMSGELLGLSNSIDDNNNNNNSRIRYDVDTKHIELANKVNSSVLNHEIKADSTALHKDIVSMTASKEIKSDTIALANILASNKISHEVDSGHIALSSAFTDTRLRHDIDEDQRAFSSALVDTKPNHDIDSDQRAFSGVFASSKVSHEVQSDHIVSSSAIGTTKGNHEVEIDSLALPSAIVTTHISHEADIDHTILPGITTTATGTTTHETNSNDPVSLLKTHASITTTHETSIHKPSLLSIIVSSPIKYEPDSIEMQASSKANITTTMKHEIEPNMTVNVSKGIYSNEYLQCLIESYASRSFESFSKVDSNTHSDEIKITELENQIIQVDLSNSRNISPESSSNITTNTIKMDNITIKGQQLIAKDYFSLEENTFPSIKALLSTEKFQTFSETYNPGIYSELKMTQPINSTNITSSTIENHQAYGIRRSVEADKITIPNTEVFASLESNGSVGSLYPHTSSTFTSNKPINTHPNESLSQLTNLGEKLLDFDYSSHKKHENVELLSLSSSLTSSLQDNDNKSFLPKLSNNNIPSSHYEPYISTISSSNQFNQDMRFNNKSQITNITNTLDFQENPIFKEIYTNIGTGLIEMKSESQNDLLKVKIDNEIQVDNNKGLDNSNINKIEIIEPFRVGRLLSKNIASEHESDDNRKGIEVIGAAAISTGDVKVEEESSITKNMTQLIENHHRHEVEKSQGFVNDSLSSWKELVTQEIKPIKVLDEEKISPWSSTVRGTNTNSKANDQEFSVPFGAYSQGLIASKSSFEDVKQSSLSQPFNQMETISRSNILYKHEFLKYLQNCNGISLSKIYRNLKCSKDIFLKLIQDHLISYSCGVNGSMIKTFYEKNGALRFLFKAQGDITQNIISLTTFLNNTKASFIKDKNKVSLNKLKNSSLAKDISILFSYSKDRIFNIHARSLRNTSGIFKLADRPNTNSSSSSKLFKFKRKSSNSPKKMSQTLPSDKIYPHIDLNIIWELEESILALENTNIPIDNRGREDYTSKNIMLNEKSRLSPKSLDNKHHKSPLSPSSIGVNHMNWFIQNLHHKHESEYWNTHKALKDMLDFRHIFYYPCDFISKLTNNTLMTIPRDQKSWNYLENNHITDPYTSKGFLIFDFYDRLLFPINLDIQTNQKYTKLWILAEINCEDIDAFNIIIYREKDRKDHVMLDYEPIFSILTKYCLNEIKERCCNKSGHYKMSQDMDNTSNEGMMKANNHPIEYFNMPNVNINSNDISSRLGLSTLSLELINIVDNARYIAGDGVNGNSGNGNTHDDVNSNSNGGYMGYPLPCDYLKRLNNSTKRVVDILIMNNYRDNNNNNNTNNDLINKQHYNNDDNSDDSCAFVCSLIEKFTEQNHYHVESIDIKDINIVKQKLKSFH